MYKSIKGEIMLDLFRKVKALFIFLLRKLGLLEQAKVVVQPFIPVELPPERTLNTFLEDAEGKYFLDSRGEKRYISKTFAKLLEK